MLGARSRVVPSHRRGSRSAQEDTLPVAEMPHSVRTADMRKVARTGIVGAAGQLFVDGFQRRGVNLYDHLAVTSDWLRELLIPRRFSQPSDVLFGQHLGCTFVQLFGSSHFFEASEQIVGPQAPFLGALKVMDNLATVHHD